MNFVTYISPSVTGFKIVQIISDLFIDMNLHKAQPADDQSMIAYDL